MSQRSGPRPTGAGRHPGTCGWVTQRPGTVSGRQCVPAGAGGPVIGTLPRPADPGTTSSGRTDRRWPWRTLLAARRRAGPRPRVPRLRPVRPRGARPRRAGARRPWAAVPLRALARPGLRPGLLRPPAVLEPASTSAPFPWLALAGLRGGAPRAARGSDRTDVSAAAVAAVDGGALGRRRGAARALRPRRVPLGPARVQPDGGPAAVAGRVRRRPAGHLRRRPHRRAAGRGRPRPAPGLARRRERGRAGPSPPRRRRSPSPASWPSRWRVRWPGCRCRDPR